MKLSKYKSPIKYYEPSIIKSGLAKFLGSKLYVDTSCVEGVNNVNNKIAITFNERPSRANMKPINGSVWFAKMKDSNKILLVTSNDKDIVNNYILSTGFLGIKATYKLPLALLFAIISSKEFLKQRDMNSVGTTMAGINNETFLKIEVPKFNEKEINDFVLMTDPLINKLSIIRREKEKLFGIKQSLLNKYF